MKVTKEVRETLANARGLLSKPGAWMQGDWDNGLQMCAIGAIRRVTGKYHLHGNGSEHPAVTALRRALPECWAKPNGKNIPIFNDAPGRRKRDILALFDHAMQGKQMPSPPKKGRD